MRGRSFTLTRRAGVAALVALALVPVGAGAAEDDSLAAREATLDAAAAWRDVLDAYRAPLWPRPAQSRMVTLMLRQAPLVGAPGNGASIDAQQAAVSSVIADLGGQVVGRTRVVANTLTVHVPTGAVEAIGRIPEVRAVVPVSFLAPAQAAGSSPDAVGSAATGRRGARVPAGRAAGTRAVHIALIDTGVDVSHPWLGGGIGPTFPIIGGFDHVDRDRDPRIDARAAQTEAHGTEMAGLVLHSSAFAGLDPTRRPRLIVHRVAGEEAIGGRVRLLARSDRVLEALETAVDPDGDGDPTDRAEVILVGLANGFAGDGSDPLVEALAGAERAGSLVVVPAGNDGPTNGRNGSLGALASSAHVLTVGGVSGPVTARTVDLRAQMGAAVATLAGLPLLGATPVDDALPVVILRDVSGLSRGDEDEDYRGRAGVRGALVVVARGGGTLQQKARVAARHGARAVAVWDEPGPATFPVTAGALDMPIPVVGLGRVQGRALAQLASRPDLTVTLGARAERHERSTVASFSSAGPTVDGRQKPELVAPAVAVPAALPGRGPDGQARVGELTGTSAAAAEVAARAAALRARDPRIGPRRARALLIASAQRLPGVASTRQGAGEVGVPDPGAATVYPPIIQVPEGARAVRLRVNDRGPAIGTYVIRLHRPHAGAVSVTVPAATARRGTSIRVSAGIEAGHLTVSSAGRRIAAAPVFARRAPTRANVDDLGTPAVRTRAGGAQIMVRIGRVHRVAGRIEAVALNDVRFELVPLAGGSPLTVLGTGQSGSWPAGTYRFLLADRDADGIEIPQGMYRLRVSARHPGGGWLRRASAPLRVR